MSDETIKEHYVPRCYLKHFSDKERFFVYDKEKKEKRPGNIKDYACERFFYDVDFDAIKADQLEINPDFEFDSEIEQILQEMDKQHIEHLFGRNVETWLYAPIEKINTIFTMSNPRIVHSLQVLSDEDMDYISAFLAIQVLRSKEFRENMTELYERLPLFLMKKFGKSQEERAAADHIELKIRNENYKKLFHAQYLTDPDIVADFAEAFRTKFWFIGHNRTKTLFYTSDNPVTRFGHAGMSGFNSRGIEIAFPITPRLVLILKDPDYFSFEAQNQNHFIEIDDDYVAFANSLQVQQSYRYVFDKTGDLKLASDMVKCNPSLSDIKRKRFLMG